MSGLSLHVQWYLQKFFLPFSSEINCSSHKHCVKHISIQMKMQSTEFCQEHAKPTGGNIILTLKPYWKTCLKTSLTGICSICWQQELCFRSFLLCNDLCSLFWHKDFLSIVKDCIAFMYRCISSNQHHITSRKQRSWLCTIIHNGPNTQIC